MKTVENGGREVKKGRIKETVIGSQIYIFQKTSYCPPPNWRWADKRKKTTNPEADRRAREGKGLLTARG